MRFCNAPEPKHGGNDCNGKNYEPISCIINDCPAGKSTIFKVSQNDQHYICAYTYKDIYWYIILGASNWCRMISKGRNCPNTEIITTEKGCKQAAEELGLSYSGVVDAASYAAGCFSIQEGVFFNKLVDPSSTYPERFLFSGGVCLNLGIRCIF